MHNDTTFDSVGPFFVLLRTDVSIFERKIGLLYPPFSYKSAFGLQRKKKITGKQIYSHLIFFISFCFTAKFWPPSDLDLVKQFWYFDYISFSQLSAMDCEICFFLLCVVVVVVVLVLFL